MESFLILKMKIYVCVHKCVYVWLCKYVCVCACEGLRLMSVTFVNTLCLVFETGSLTAPETHRFGYAGWPASSKDPSSASQHCSGIIVTPPQMQPFFHVDFDGSNSGSHT